MRIDAIEFRDSVLEVKCSGPFGDGSQGNPSGELVKMSVERWITVHPGERVRQIDVDYSDVDYSLGDGPVASIVPFVRKGVSKIRLIASSRNRDALEALVRASGLDCVVVDESDA